MMKRKRRILHQQMKLITAAKRPHPQVNVLHKFQGHESLSGANIYWDNKQISIFCDAKL